MKWYNAIPLGIAASLVAACGETPTASTLAPRAASRDEAPAPITVPWTGQGINADGTFGTVICAGDGAADQNTPSGPYIHWIFTATGGSSATITINGTTYPMTQQGAGDGAFHFYQTENVPSDLRTLLPGGDPPIAKVSATALGSTATNAQLTISHGCPGTVPPQAILALTKTASTTYRRTWKWGVTKSVTPTTMTLPINTTQSAAYTVTFSAVSSDDQFVVSGDITVSNSGTADALVTDISDDLSGAVLTCPTFPATVSAGGTVKCTYTASVSSAASGTNKASATATKLDRTNILIDDATAEYTFPANATTEVNRCVDVSDTKKTLNPSNICAPQDGSAYSTVYSYSLTVGPYTATSCGPQNFPNTASFTPKSAAAITDANSASANVSVTVTGCQGCTPGYWKNNTAAWGPTNFTTSNPLYAAFGSASVIVSPWTYTDGSLGYILNGKNLGAYTMLQGLGFQGNSTLEGKGEILLRAGAAALLNASWSSPGKTFAYPLTPSDVKSQVLGALAAPGSAANGYQNLVNTAATLDKYNNYSCPLNSRGSWIGG